MGLTCATCLLIPVLGFTGDLNNAYRHGIRTSFETLPELPDFDLR